MERRSDQRVPCHRKALVLSYGCQIRGWISDWSWTGLRLQLSEGLALEDREAFVLSCERFGVLHAEVIWQNGETIGASIRNWRTAAISHRIAPYLMHLPAG